MPQYTTGELAKLCGVSVRTVQFYDAKGLLPPAALSEGGRRLYAEGDLARLRLILLLKSLGLSLEAVRGVLKSEASTEILLLLLDEQAKALDGELRELQQRRRAIDAVRRGIRSVEIADAGSLCDMGRIMKTRKELKKARAILLAAGILLDLAELGAILLWILRGIWLPFAVVMPLVILAAALLSRMYYRATAYICPSCHAVFRPTFRESFFARHTYRTRRLTCTVCGKKDWCIETAASELQE